MNFKNDAKRVRAGAKRRARDRDLNGEGSDGQESESQKTDYDA
jgi:hypothetical protein